MNAALIAIALVTIGAAVIALSCRNLLHSVLLLAGSWTGVAAFFLWAGAEFAAFAQVLVYVGAISMVVLFAVLLTRRSREDSAPGPAVRGRAGWALGTGGLVAVVLLVAVGGTAPAVSPSPPPVLTVRQIGEQLMGPQAAALLAVGVLLTAALLGAVVLAAAGRPGNGKDQP